MERYQPLVEKDVISKQQYDAAVAAAAANRASVLEAESTLIAQQEAVRQSQQKLAQARSTAVEATRNGPSQIKAQQARAVAAQAAVKEAQARVDQAKLNLSYTKILAPTTGIVNKKNVNVGANLSVGQDLLTIIPLTNLLGNGELQRDPVGAHARRSEGCDQGRCTGRKEVPWNHPSDRWRNRFQTLALPARERNWKLCEGGSAYSRPYRLHESGPGEQRS